MSSKIRKRSGHQVPFDMDKIFKAVESAFESCGKKCPATFRSILNQNINRFKTAATVERIQDEIESLLLSCGYVDIYKHFSSYRAQRQIMREIKQTEVYKSIVNTERNDITNDNANQNAETPSGMMYKFGAEGTKAFGKDVLAPRFREPFNSGHIHIHDFDHYVFGAFNCLQSPMDRIMKYGLNSGHGEARSPKRIETASFLCMISLETTQNEMFGGQGIPAFDFYLAPFVRKTYEQEIDLIAEVLKWDDAKIIEYKEYPIADYLPELFDNEWVKLAVERTRNRVYQAMESFIHNANAIHSRGGNQTVFSSINYGTDTSAEGRCIIRELLASTMAGVGNGATAIFPIQIMKMKEGVNKNPGDPNYDLYKAAWPVTARRFFPNYLNLDASFYKTDYWYPNDPKRYVYEPATMGCRTSVFKDRFLDYPTTVGRGNLSFTTLNLPLIALEIAIEDGYYKKTDAGYEIDTEHDTPERMEARIKKFHEKVQEYCDLTAEQLYERFEMQAKTKKYQYPLTMSGMYMGSDALKPTDEVREVLKHGTLSIGFVGLAEALIALTGKHHGEDSYSQQVGLSVIKQMYDACNEYSEKYNMNYSCFATPAESVAGKMEKIVKAKYGSIKDITDRGYFTNSNHVPVWYHCSPQHKAEIEGPYHKFTTAGHIFYVETDGDLEKNPEYVDAINRAAWKNDMGYNAINHTTARCPQCNYEYDGPADEAPEKCPHCGAKMDVLQRITGYLSNVASKWNSGKQAELRDRVVHS